MQLQPLRIENLQPFSFSVLVTEVCDWSARIVNVVATMVLKSIVDVEMYYIYAESLYELRGHYRDC